MENSTISSVRRFIRDTYFKILELQRKQILNDDELEELDNCQTLKSEMEKHLAVLQGK